MIEIKVFGKIGEGKTSIVRCIKEALEKANIQVQIDSTLCKEIILEDSHERPEDRQIARLKEISGKGPVKISEVTVVRESFEKVKKGIKKRLKF